VAKKKVLVIDDDQAIIDSTTAILESNYEVETAMNGKAGLEKVDSFKPDVIILDLLMPGVDGFDVCRTLKEDEKYKGIPIIALSSFTELYGMRFGNDETKSQLPSEVYLSKPLDPQTLIREIEEQTS